MGILQLLQPLYPGQFPMIKHNMFNTVLVMDLSQTSNVYLITTAVANVINRGLPFRFGIVPLIEDEDSEWSRFIALA
jgi:UDP-glucose:glycoprotein glucosyltransferase